MGLAFVGREISFELKVFPIDSADKEMYKEMFTLRGAGSNLTNSWKVPQAR